MALTGDLGSIDLANVFQMLQLSQKTGTLEVRSHGGRSEVYLEGEHVLYPFDRDAFPKKVIRRLERCGKVTAEMLAKAQASGSVLQRDLFAMLVQMRVLTPEEVTAAYREQMEEEIYELFVDRDAAFEFRENEKPNLPGKTIDERYRLASAGLIMEAARRIDEWGFIRQRVPSDRCVFEAGAAIDQVPEQDRDTALVEVFGALDGMRSVAELVETTELTRFIVCKKLAILAELRVVYEVPLEVLLERARECLRGRKSIDGLKLLERAFELGANEASVHEMAALANQALHRIGEACRHYALVADGLERAGDRRGAAEIHLRVRDLMPTDVRSRERLVRHWLDDRAFFDQTNYSAEAEAIELLAILKELGRGDDARELLKEVRERFKEDSRVTMRLADVAIELGDPKAAVEMLLACADELFKRRNEASALRLYRRVRTIAPDHEGLELRIGACEQVVRRTAYGNRHGAMRLAASFVMLAAIGVAFSINNREALAELAEIPTEELALAGDFETALSTLATFCSEHPVTVAALIARREMQDVEDRARMAAEEAARRTDLLSQERARRRRNAERAYTDALELLRRGDHAGALEKMERAAELANDSEFIADRKPHEKAEEIRAFLRAGQEAMNRYEEARRREDWPALHRLGVELLRGVPRAQVADALLLPVHVTADPKDASVTVTQLPKGAMALLRGSVVLLAAGHDATVTATRADRFPTSITIRPENAFEVTLQLDRKPERATELPTRALHRPVVAGGRAFFGCADGRVVALDATTLAPLWQKTLADLEEVGGPPQCDERGLRVVTRSQRVVWFDPVSGETIGRELDVAGRASATAGLTVPLSGGASFAVDPQGRISLRSAEGRSLAAWRSPARIEWALASPGGALFGGGTLVLRIADERPGANKSDREERR